ncbi:MAG TPA: bifunctional hexulose-6-phosphate synthase/ribonuclease regulator [Methanomicrobiales archaeon]|nr:bifunctional hexulose-6-phosphate synthase/ribonuclease regulator [Methanomicrobiales archaeon]
MSPAAEGGRQGQGRAPKGTRTGGARGIRRRGAKGIQAGPVLQVALDLLEPDRAVAIAREAVLGGADWVEAGTPLIKSAGMEAVRRLRSEFPDREIVADMKVADTGTLEVEMAAKSGAGIVCILATADDEVVREAVRAKQLYGVRIMADLINSHDPVGRAVRLGELGVDIIAAHAGIDQQMVGVTSVDLVKDLAGRVTVPIAVAGGLDAESAAEAVRSGASIVIVGGNIVRSGDVTGSTRTIRRAIDRPGSRRKGARSRDDEIRELLMGTSTPNISDAMHRKGAMQGILSLCGDVKIAGRAVTVQTFAGDWAKPVEAIDRAGPGDVIVINNDGGVHVAPWGELATRSCMVKGIAGVVIDGAVRDVDDIRRIGYPVFARAVVPNAGEPKGFGEINTEIACCGQVVRPGDWVVGDENGVVVIPGERVYEVARRAREVQKGEERIREEISRGGTLSSIMELGKWEKR